jgi:5-methyltetrahydropteroyltriglutamate--homocysteine methyltransferase
MALKHIPAERLVLSSDCGMGREGMARRHALYKMVSLVQGTNIVRKELGIPEAECIAANSDLTLLDVRKAAPAPAAAKSGKQAAKKKKK